MSMAGEFPRRASCSGRQNSSVSNNLHSNEVIPWYFTREKIEKYSPSRRDGIDLKTEIFLRNSYCTYLNQLGVKLKVPQLTIATAIVFCHRFFISQSHAKNDRWTIATACMFLAGKVEETPRWLKDIIVVSYETIHKKTLSASQRKEVYEHQRELILRGEEILLSTLNFDFSIRHPYKPLIDAIKKYQFEDIKPQFPQVAWSFINDGLHTSLSLQYQPHHIAASAFLLAAEYLKMELKSYRLALCQEFNITVHQLADIRRQMFEHYERKHNASSQGSLVESSGNGSVVNQPVSMASKDRSLRSVNGGSSSKVKLSSKSNDKERQIFDDQAVCNKSMTEGIMNKTLHKPVNVECKKKSMMNKRDSMEMSNEIDTSMEVKRQSLLKVENFNDMEEGEIVD